MKVGIFSHCTMDTIVYENEQYDAPGGPASYCSLTARKQKHDVNLYTKFGPNYPLEEFFKENKINAPDSLSTQSTTRFKIELNGSDRKLFLENMCDKINFIENDNDGVIISPVFNEISLETNQETTSSNVSEELPVQTQEVILENKDEEKNSLILENEYKEEEKTSNGLENFQLEDDTPELFDSGNTLETENNDQEFSSFSKEQNEDEDELEIPAFLRRQNN